VPNSSVCSPPATRGAYRSTSRRTRPRAATGTRRAEEPRARSRRAARAGGCAKADVAAIDGELDELVDDDEFWRYKARSVALFVTPTTTTTFRLPNNLGAAVEVSDRFHLKPLLRALTFPHTAFVLGLSQNSVRLLEIAPDLAPGEIDVPDLPKDVASAVGKSSIQDRAPIGKVQASEGQKMRMRQYARQIDQALRPLLNGLDVPLILAAAEPLDSIYRSVNSYPNLVAASLPATRTPALTRS
jgi:hypothetical protein